MYDWVVLGDWVEIARALAACDHGHRLDRLVLLLHRAGPWPAQDRQPAARGADGEEWQVHGGGFYHIQKYLVAPEMMPEHLTWFKWESYATWLSGFAMLVLVYYLGADLLPDRPRGDGSVAGLAGHRHFAGLAGLRLDRL